MFNFKKNLFLFLFLFSVNIFSKYITDSNWGFKVKAPGDWKYQKQGENLLLGHNTIAGMIIVAPNNFKSMAELRKNMKDGIHEGGVSLNLTGKLIKNKNTYKGNYVGVYNGEKIKGISIGSFSSNGGYIILALSTPDKFSKKLSSVVFWISKNIKYIKQSSNLKSHFTGTWKTVTKNSETIVTLRADGKYISNYESSYSGSNGGWGMANNDNYSGTWRVKGNKKQGVLILTDRNGESDNYNYRVHVKNGKIFWTEYYYNNVLFWKTR